MRALHALLVIALAAVLLAAACSKGRPLEGDLAQRVSWQEDVAPLFAADCNSCHSGKSPAGGYDTTSYLAALGPKGARVAVAGDPGSQLLRTLDPARADAVHAKVASVYPTVRAWVVDGRLSYNRSGVHEGGVLNPDDPDEFHGAVLEHSNWNFATCQKCHGADYSGGVAGVSCNQCHTQPGGPTACDTCHGQPPRSGAHVAHVKTAALDCSECHVKPQHFDDPGHLTGPDGKAKQKATITFGQRAALGTTGRTGAPSWDGTTCSNVYCHGVTLQDSKATSTTPTWTGASACGSCHGTPPANHPTFWTSCTGCHPQSVKPGTPAQLIPAAHDDGKVDVGTGVDNCASCHGNGTTRACPPGAPCAAPPRDVSGNTDPSFIGVGAHQAHVVGSQLISAPIACSACHVVPNTTADPGHIDHALPATVAFSDLAKADSAAPSWDHASATCSNTYCHGGGAKLGTDTAFKLRTPNWTLGTSQAFCGSCHGLPPADGQHAGFTYPKDCATCHPSTVAPNGAIIVSGSPRTSTHLNGVIDVTP